MLSVSASSETVCLTCAALAFLPPKTSSGNSIASRLKNREKRFRRRGQKFVHDKKWCKCIKGPIRR